MPNWMLNSSFPTHEVLQEAVEVTCTGVGGRLLFHWVSKVFCLSLVLNVFFLPFRIHTFSSGLSQLHCLLVKVILVHSGNCQFSGFCVFELIF